MKTAGQATISHYQLRLLGQITLKGQKGHMTWQQVAGKSAVSFHPWGGRPTVVCPHMLFNAPWSKLLP